MRKLRIQSAITQGARWSRTLNDKITHVIVDSNITAEAVAKVLKQQLDLGKVALVKDRWLIESASHKAVRDPTQERFQLKDANGTSKVNKQNKLPSPIAPLETTKSQTPDDGPSLGVSATKDELAEIMQDMKAAEHLPFDVELDLETYTSFDMDDVHAAEKVEASSLSIDSGKIPRENRGFACMEPNNGTADENNPNKRTIEILQQMATYYDRTGDQWRTTAYRKAISALRKQTSLVSTKKQAQKIFGVGTRLAEKIEEIVATDSLRRLDSVLSNPDDKVLQLFMGIYGVGIQHARFWIEQGYRTLDDLRAHATLTVNQQIGIEHYDDFHQRIPRAEVAQHGAIVQRAVKRADKSLEAIVGGSYRRGMLDSGDIDLMITHPSAELSELRVYVFDVVVPYLFKTGFMKCALATSRSTSLKQAQTSPANTRSEAHETPEGTTKIGASVVAPYFAPSCDSGTKFHGASALTSASPWRRIDLLLVPATSLGASLIYFTGNDIFNRSLRLLASRKKMRLNQYGLYKNVMRGPGRVKETEGELLEGRSEKRIFEILGVPWRPPEQRIC